MKRPGRRRPTRRKSRCRLTADELLPLTTLPRAHDATLWLPYLRWGFAAGMTGAGPVALSRPVVDRAMGELHMLRNGVTHHEPLLNTDLPARQSDILLLLGLIDPDLSRHVQHHSTWATVQASRP